LSVPKLRPLEPGVGPGDEEGLYFLNNKYQVFIRTMVDGESVEHHMLSIKRLDRRPIMDWRDLQWIKNELLGPEEEMVQIFPAESRVVDTSNQYWFFHYPGRRWPFGFRDRLVTEGLSVTVGDMGRPSQQRPFAPRHRPGDLAEQQEKGRQMLLRNGFRALGIIAEEPLCATKPCSAWPSSRRIAASSTSGNLAVA